MSPDQFIARMKKGVFAPAYRLAPFHPEAVNAFLGQLLWHADGRIETGFIPVHIDPPGRPVLADEAQAIRITDYVKQITKAAGLPTLTLKPRSDMVVIS